MKSPKELYEVYKRIDDIEKVAYERLIENYLQLELKGDKKLIEIDSTDQESLISRFNHGMPVPGLIYIFINLDTKNLAELENFKTGKQVTFHDFTPLVFCTSFNPMTKLMKGINLNILPPSERLKFLQAYYEYYKVFFQKIDEKIENGKLAINYTYIMATILGKNPQLFEIFNKKYNTLFEFGYRSYYLKSVRKFRMIEYEEWKYIPFLVPAYAFKRINLQMLYQMYWANRNDKE